MQVQIEGVKMAMWEKTEMPEKRLNPESGKYEKTGQKEERTTYTFKDEFGEKLTFLGKNDWRELEGRDCDITLAIRYNDFDRVTRVSLQECLPAD